MVSLGVHLLLLIAIDAALPCSVSCLCDSDGDYAHEIHVYRMVQGQTNAHQK